MNTKAMTDRQILTAAIVLMERARAALGRGK